MAGFFNKLKNAGNVRCLALKFHSRLFRPSILIISSVFSHRVRDVLADRLWYPDYIEPREQRCAEQKDRQGRASSRAYSFGEDAANRWPIEGRRYR